jgi:hypothetical protein
MSKSNLDLIQEANTNLIAARDHLNYIKSDDIVDDDVCDLAVDSLRKAQESLIEVLGALGEESSLDPIAELPAYDEDEDE